ncbi:hypothetical protein BUALT_Bualt03G0047300 [Buddleja alternifolia]|uniref:Uncharacterized protein n=1 Tax=Buddleja alternifolia TaxID=168488 RepID=A0AAV6XZF7_9LAMI|nr:hypothetical protein BUALT_Bualt03G0047300 [Buddleja alternifolia]
MASSRNISLVILICIFASSSYQATSLISRDHIMSMKHEKWMSQYNRYYESKEEKVKRFKIFKYNVDYIESFNRVGTHTYQLGINQFADMTSEEFLAKYTGNSMPSFQSSPVAPFKYENVKDVPPSLDWREKNAVTPVQSQGPCGSCWAFSAVAAIEGIVQIKSGVLTSLSEQQIIDCDGAFDGCQGGRMEKAFEFVERNGGLASDTDYPYQTMEGVCSTNTPSSLAASITGIGGVPQNNETAMLMAVANQPISVGIDPSLFQFYRSGVLTGECGTNRTHAITAVGYGTSEDGIKFWLFKNSWGPWWGEDGYIRIQRDVDVVEGMCGLAMDLTYPIA